MTKDLNNDTNKDINDNSALSISGRLKLYMRKQKERPQTVREEVFNSITHGIGTVAAAAGTIILVALSISMGRPASITAGVAIYGAAMILLYLASTLYHCLSFTKAREIFKIFDHCAIFILIAGTYTPIAFQIGGTWGWSMFGIVWGLTVLGIVLESVFKSGVKKISMFIYLAMGWLVVIAWNPFLDHVNYGMVFWLMAGGIAYTGGVLFYILPGHHFFHVLWHFAVLAGSVFHYFGILFYIVL